MFMQSLTDSPEQLLKNVPVFVKSTRLLADVYGLYPEERLLIAKAIPKRRAEFCAGRNCARQALGKIGQATTSIVADANGCPIWPTGVVGSISHTKNYAVAAVARATDIHAIGIDIELWQKNSPNWCSIKTICSSSEQEWIEALPEHLKILAAHVLFSARESIYKCVYSATKTKLAANHLVVNLSPEKNTFSATVTAKMTQTYCYLEGGFGFNDDYVFSAVWTPNLTP